MQEGRAYLYGSTFILEGTNYVQTLHQKVRADTPSFAYAHYVAGYGEEARCLVYFFLLLI